LLAFPTGFVACSGSSDSHTDSATLLPPESMTPAAAIGNQRPRLWEADGITDRI
jgi:hypothetical protein